MSFFCLQSQTSISGSIFNNTTWSISGSPYIVSGKLVVFPAATLTINPGVLIKFNSGASIELRGKMTANGNATDSITFTSNASSPAMNNWNGIKVLGNPTGSTTGNQMIMNYVRASYTTTFVDLDYATNGPYVFKHCRFFNNSNVNFDTGSPSTLFDSCKFDHNFNGLTYGNFNSRVRHSQFLYNVNGLEGFSKVDTCFFSHNSGIACSPYGSTVGCTIVDNYIGVSCGFNGANNNFVNNILFKNYIGMEIKSFFNGGSILFSGNTICSSLSFNIQLIHTNNTDLSNNCWCSNDSSYIASKIFDGYVNNSVGLVNFMPLSTNCVPLVSEINEPLASKKSNLEIFPNPFNEKIIIQSNSLEDVEFSLYNIESKKLMNQYFNQKLILDTKELSAGMYYYKIHNTESIQTGKLIKK